MKRLSSMDANFLYIETHAAPMHYLLIGVFEGELTLAELEQGIRANLLQLPRFTQKVVPHRFRLRHPSWQPDPLFNLCRHLFELQLTQPGTDDELLALGAKIFVGVMDRGKPLWEMHLVHGLSGNRSAVIVKMHHCMADGGAALELMKVMTTSSAMPGLNQQKSEKRNGLAASNGHPSPLKRIRTATASLSHSARRELFVLGALATRRKPLPFNRTPSGERILCRCEYSSAEARAIGAACGATMSDVMLSVLAGGVRRYLELHQYSTAGRNLRVMLSVNLRRNTHYEESSNLATVCPIDIPLDLNNPLESLQYVTARSKKVKDARLAEGLDAFLTVLGKTPVPVQFWSAVVLRNRSTLPYNIILTNVSSLRLPGYIFGRRVLGIYPFPTIPYSIGVSCGLLEYDEKVNLLLTMDAQAVPDGQRLRECLEQSFATLRDAAGVTMPESFSERLQQASETNRYELLSEYVREQVATVLHRDDEPDPQQGFFDLGMDSLSTLELADRLQTGLGRQLPATLIFETPNIEALTNYLAGEVLGWNDLNGQKIQASSTHVETPHQLLEKIQHLSDDEVDRLLAKT